MTRRLKRWKHVKGGFATAVLVGALVVSLPGCTSSSTVSSAATSGATSSGSVSPTATVSTAYSADIDESPYNLEYSNRDKDASYDKATATKIALSGASATVEGSNATVEGSTVTVTAGGVYVLSGSLEGQVVVNAPDDAKVQLVLDGATISNASGSAVYVQQADKCFITLAGGSTNAVSDGVGYTFEDGSDELDAAIYSTCDLTLQGSGSMTVASVYNDAVKTKDDLVITGGTYGIAAKGDGLVGHDSVKIAEGTITVKTTEGDAIKSSKDDDETKGFVSIDGGTITADAADKGVNAETYLRVGEGATLDIVAADDALHSNHYAKIAGGDITLSSGDDALHAEYVLVVDAGDIDVTKCVEGYEAQVITINDATTHIVASDDGINASTGGTSSSQNGASGFGGQGRMGDNGAMPDMPSGEAPSGNVPDMPSRGSAPSMPSGEAPSAPSMPSGGAQSTGIASTQVSGNPSQTLAQKGGMGNEGGMGGMGGGMADSDANCILTINGGVTVVEAEGDGVDSNGYIYVNGGVTLVSGPTNSGNGSLDYGIGAEINRGTFLAAGSAGMAETFTGGSQGFALVNASGSAGDEVAVLDASNNVLAWYAPTKSFQCVLVSTDGMVDGGSYSVNVGGTASVGSGVEFVAGEAARGLNVQGGTSTGFTATTQGGAMGFGGQVPGGMGGGRNRDGGSMPDGGQGRDGGFGGGQGRGGSADSRSLPSAGSTATQV